MRDTLTGLLTIMLTLAWSQVPDRDRFLCQFDTPAAAEAWQIVNDDVMGGRSVSRFKIDDQAKLVFSGTLSLENNGGFASVRARGKNLALTLGESIFLRVRGDGRQYEFNLYTQPNFSGYSYRQSFQTISGKWMEIELPVNRFVATWRGRAFPNEKLDAGNVRGLGFLLGDKKAGPFQLEVEWIKAGPTRK
jgi:monofunctional biosynthetic peptidoglycan transglycosylase